MGVFWWGFEFQGGGGGGGGEGGGRVGGGWGDVVVLGVFFGSVVGCLGMSAVYHCVSCHSEVVEGWAQRGDHVGIVVLIWGSFVPSLWYGFSCEKGLRGVYWGMVSFFFRVRICLFFPLPLPAFSLFFSLSPAPQRWGRKVMKSINTKRNIHIHTLKNPPGS